jgi:hypothetical protein
MKIMHQKKAIEPAMEAVCRYENNAEHKVEPAMEAVCSL